MTRYAIDWIKEINSVLNANKLKWVTPVIVVNGGKVIFKWTNGHRKLTVFVSDAGSVDYTKSAVTIEGKVNKEDGKLIDQNQIVDLWNWLYPITDE
jgi:hypothetical protein